MSRGTQFSGFAHRMTNEIIGLLIERGLLDLDENDNHVIDECALLATRRAHDLACHVVSETIGGPSKDIVAGIPDLTTWPEETEKP